MEEGGGGGGGGGINTSYTYRCDLLKCSQNQSVHFQPSQLLLSGVVDRIELESVLDFVEGEPENTTQG